MSSGSKSVVGKAASVDTNWDGTFGAFCGVLRPKPALDWRYFGLFFQTRDYRNRISELAAGVNINNLKREYFEDVLLPLAPPPEQGRIVASVEQLLAHVNAARERLSRVPAILKRFRRAVLAAACSGRLTADWRESQAAVAQNNASTALSQDLVMPDLPDGWLVCVLDNCCSKIIDGNYGAEYPTKDEFKTAGIPFITSAAIGKNGEIIESELRFISPDKNTLLRKAQTTVGDVIFTNRGARVGATALLSEPRFSVSNIGPQVTRLVARPGVLMAQYLLFWMRAPFFLTAMRERNGGSAMNFLNLTVTKELPIVLPPLREQEEIVHRVEALFKLADTIEQRVAAGTVRAEILTQAILAKAFRGELVPTEAELARREGRPYESAADLLARIRAARDTDSKSGDGPNPRKRRNK